MSPSKKNPKKTSHALEAAARRELEVALDKRHQASEWGGELSPGMLRYAADDARILIPLAAALESKIVGAGLEWVADIERRALPAMVWMANAGVPFDADGWGACLEGEVAEKIGRSGLALDRLAPARPGGKGWNWRSSKQVLEAFGLLGVRLPNTQEDTLARCDHPLAEALLDYKNASKLVSNFGPPLLDMVEADGRIYADWRQIGAGTGRMSCSRPNLQQLPPEVRRHVWASQGRALVWADYAQAELRILAEASGEPALVAAFRGGRDPYRATAASTFGVPEAEVTEEQRGAAKQINFGIVYGMTPRGLAKRLGTGAREARRLMDQYFAAYPKVEAFLEKSADDALRTGEARSLCGRVRRFGNVAAMSGRERRVVRRQAKNMPMQGTCADGLKLALALIWERRRGCPSAVPILALHDEIVVECDEGDAEAAKAWLEKAMLDGMDEAINGAGVEGPRVPIGVEVESGRTWAG